MHEVSGIGGSPEEEISIPSVSLVADVTRRVNFASAQNDVAIIRSLALANNTDQPIEDVTVTPGCVGEDIPLADADHIHGRSYRIGTPDE